MGGTPGSRTRVLITRTPESCVDRPPWEQRGDPGYDHRHRLTDAAAAARPPSLRSCGESFWGAPVGPPPGRLPACGVLRRGPNGSGGLPGPWKRKSCCWTWASRRAAEGWAPFSRGRRRRPPEEQPRALRTQSAPGVSCRPLLVPAGTTTGGRVRPEVTSVQGSLQPPGTEDRSAPGTTGGALYTNPFNSHSPQETLP